MTAKEIAEIAGVSPATVSNVLNGRKNVGKETRERILKICEEEGFSLDIESGTSRDPKIILFNFSDFDRKFYLRIIHGISDYVYSHGYDLIVSTTNSCARFMDSKFTSGAIILDSKCKDTMLMEKARLGYKIITMDRIFEDPNIRSVVVNNYDPMTKLMEELVKHGYRKYAFLAGLDTSDNQERYKAFLDVLEKHQILLPKDHYYIGDFKEKSGYQAARLMILSGNLPEVLVCANDNMAIGAMKAIKREGLRIPEDVAITGFDGNETAEMMGLTTVEIPNYERGYLAAQCLIQLIAGTLEENMLRISAAVKIRDSIHFVK